MLILSATTVGMWALIPKAALATLSACGLLRALDRRLAAVPPALVLACIGGAACFAASWQTQVNAERLAWLTAAGCASVAVLLGLRTWLRTTPDQLHRETSRIDAASSQAKEKVSSKRKKSKAKARKSDTTDAIPWRFELALILLAAVAACLALEWSHQARFARFEGAWRIGTHQLAIGLVWGVTIFCAAQVCWLSTPDALNPSQGPRLTWNWVAWIALVLFLVEMGLCCLIFFSASESRDVELSTRVLTRVFALGLMTINFIMWMVPHRVAGFQRGRTVSGWVSLALAACLACLAAAVVCALPAEWPWDSL